MGPWLAAGEDRRLGGLDGDKLDIGVTLLEEATSAGDSATGANASNEVVNLAVSALPNFGTSGFVVDFRIVGVGKLLKHVSVRSGSDKLLGLLNSTFHALSGVRKDELGTEGAEEDAALKGHGSRHGQDKLVATRRSDKGETNASVAAGGLDEGSLAGSNKTILLCGLNHAIADPVLNGAARLHNLKLGDDFTIASFVNLVKVYHRRVADQLRNIVCDSHVGFRGSFAQRRNFAETNVSLLANKGRSATSRVQHSIITAL
mmetsp:Transcript_25065/g.45391  ORF Transcript_25065/g.45391 Transcript_25065/m.45391 type:complete len:260 (+) Transcript_25065:146-925(+)